MRHHNFAAILFAAALLSGSIAAIENADAKMVGPKASGYAIEQCLLADDAQTAENETKSACCSRAAGICVVCPKPPSAGASCDVTPYRPNPISSPRAMSPDTLNGLGVLTK
jgi:hypothetical protein